MRKCTGREDYNVMCVWRGVYTLHRAHTNTSDNSDLVFSLWGASQHIHSQPVYAYDPKLERVEEKCVCWGCHWCACRWCVAHEWARSFICRWEGMKEEEGGTAGAFRALLDVLNCHWSSWILGNGVQVFDTLILFHWFWCLFNFPIIQSIISRSTILNRWHTLT